MKTAGVDESILSFTGTARVYESQDAAVVGILGNQVAAGDGIRCRIVVSGRGIVASENELIVPARKVADDLEISRSGADAGGVSR